MRVYRLKPILDDPRFEGFGWDLPGITNENGRTYDFTHFYPTTENFKVPSLKGEWDTPEFTFQQNVNPFNDFPCCDFHVPVFSRRAAETLRPLLEANGELLPVRSRFGIYYAYQTTTLTYGVLNSKRSKGIRLDGNSNYFFDISFYKFYKTKLRGLSIFRVIEHPSEILVTDGFRERIEANQLLGFHLEPLWPESTDDGAGPLKMKKQTYERAQARTLVLQLGIDRVAPTNSQRRSIDGLRTRIADALVLTDAHEKYIGGLAGENLRDGYVELLIPCPNPKKLFQTLRDCIDEFGWKGEKRVLGRDGPYWDVDAEAHDLGEQ